jgi:uncharacterized coiled-coil DUF342 family protein
MSKVEEAVTPTADARKLALRCKTLELQLRQSVSKKEHHEVTSKLERQIDDLEKELRRAKEENQKTLALNKQISGVETLISSLIKAANAQAKALDSIEEDGTARGKALNAQGKALDALAGKMTQGTVPSQIYLQSLAKIRELEEDKRGMVRRFEYNSLENRCEELSRRLGTMVPSSDYAALKERLDEASAQIGNMVPASNHAALRQRLEELEGVISTMVPREQLVASETRVSELEARLAEHVPQTVYYDLVSKVVALAEAVTGGGEQEAVRPERLETTEPPMSAAPTIPQMASMEAAEASVAPIPAATVPEAAAAEAEVVEAAPAPEPAEATSEATPEPQVGPAIIDEGEAQSSPSPSPVPEVTAPEAQTAEGQGAEEGAAAEAGQAPPAEPEATSLGTSVEHLSEPVSEVREIQSQLAELNSKAQETNDTVIAVATTAETRGERETVPPTTAAAETAETTNSTPTTAPAFTFSGTDIVVVRTGQELAQAIGKLPTDVLETDIKSSDVERWVASSLCDDSTADSLRRIRERGVVGEDLRSQVLSITVAKYAAEPPAVVLGVATSAAAEGGATMTMTEEGASEKREEDATTTTAAPTISAPSSEGADTTV